MRTRGRELALGALCGTVIAIATPAVADAVAWGLPVLGLGGGSTGTTQLGPDTTALPASPPLFGANSWRNRRLPNTEPIDRHSAGYVAELRREVRTYGAWVNASRSSIPIYVAGPRTPARAVQIDRPWNPKTPPRAVDRDLAAQWSSVPLPAGVQPAAGSDAALVVYQPATDTAWEFWRFRYDLLGNPHARYGGRIRGVSRDPGYYRDPPGGPGRRFGATSTSIPMLAGIQRIRELQAGSIDHAVEFSAPGWKQDFFRWPAQRTDVNPAHVPPAHPLPEGIRFRLPPRLDLDALGLPPYTRMLAKAVQRYGMVMDNAGAVVTFGAEAPRPDEPDPYRGPAGIFGGQRPNQLLASFPWDRLQAIANTGRP